MKYMQNVSNNKNKTFLLYGQLSVLSNTCKILFYFFLNIYFNSCYILLRVCICSYCWIFCDRDEIVAVFLCVVVFWRKLLFNSILNWLKTVSDNHSANFSWPTFLKQLAILRKLFSFPALLFHVMSNDKQVSSKGKSCSADKYNILFIILREI